MSARTLKLDAKPIPGSSAFAGVATQRGRFLCTCGHPAGHLHPEDAIECVGVMAAELTADVREALTHRVKSASLGA
jgi:hypothetical protein